MIIYITGAPGTGKTTILKSLPIKGYDLDDIYESNWKKHRKIETVQKGAKKDIEDLISKHKNIVFVGLAALGPLPFTPDEIIILTRTDYENYFRQKLVRDLRILCDNQKEYEDLFMKKPVDEFMLNFPYNEIVNMRTFDEFKVWVHKMNDFLKKDFPLAKSLTQSQILSHIKSLSL